jgi:hypothetical protein
VSLGKVPPGPNFGNENYEWNICEISNIHDEIKYHQNMTCEKMMISTTSGKLSKHDSILVDLYISVHFFKEKHETLGASGNPPDFSAPCSERSRSRRALLPCNPKHPTVLTAMHIPCIFPLVPPVPIELLAINSWQQ